MNVMHVKSVQTGAISLTPFLLDIHPKVHQKQLMHWEMGCSTLSNYLIHYSLLIALENREQRMPNQQAYFDHLAFFFHDKLE